MNLENDKKKITEDFFLGINAANVELFGFIKEHFEVVKPVFPLVEFIVSRLSCVTELAVKGNNWDAEIIYRSALECLIKLIFITSGEGVEKEIRLKEFWEDLCEIASIKQSEQAKKSLKLYGSDKTLRLAFTPMLLSEEEEQRLRAKWPKSERQKVEQKWSFSEMIVALSKNYKGNPVEMFIGLGHNYRYASHVSHADETGILIIKERDERPKCERDLADFAHYIKLMSDSFYFTISMAINIVAFVGKDPKPFMDLTKSTKEASELANIYLDKLHDDKAYDKFRN